MAKRKTSNLMVNLYEWAHDKFPQDADCRPIFAPKVLEETDFDIESVTEISIFGLPIDIILVRIEKKEKLKCNGLRRNGFFDTESVLQNASFEI